MLNLSSVSDLASLITSAVGSIDVHASWVDLPNGATSATPGRTATPQITTATTTTVVAAPAASTTRNIKFVSIRNVHATTTNTVTFRVTDGTTTSVLVSVALLAGYSLTYNDGSGWTLIDSSGGVVEITGPGRFLRSTVVSSASANHTVGADARFVSIRGVGGGGGGGGCTSVASAAAAAGGGGGGAFLEKFVGVTGGTAYAYTCGAAGAGASGAGGGNGGNSTFVIGATTYTAPGGTGAPVGTAATTLTARAGGAGGVVPTNGDVNVLGDNGGYGVTLIVATPILASGHGASSRFGSGGIGLVAVGAGNNATGFGAGGGGAATGASTVRTGGNGTAGCWVIDEYS